MLIIIFCVLVTSQLSLADNADLPDNLLIGFATASYQIEGAWNENGKGENIWDRLVHTNPDYIGDHSNGDVACDSYHKYKDDIYILKDTGAQIYRLSLSWSRLLPAGEVNTINQDGVDYYNNLINGLLENDIQPLVTLYHWDLPQPFQDLGGWTNPIMINYFEDYARFAFSTFGDRVKYWITFNEPLEVTKSGYGDTGKAPALNHKGTADYLAAHNLLLSHARVYHLYDEIFRSTQQGIIGIALNGGWNEPKTNTTSDIDASIRVNEFEVGWFANPIFVGDYPEIMRKVIDENSKQEGRPRSRLPSFTPQEIDYVKGTSDFYGLNHYTTYYAEPGDGNQGPTPSFYRDRDVVQSSDDSWLTSASGWLRVVPWGFRKMLNYVQTKYGDPIIIITENGVSDWGGLEDDSRVRYYHDYLQQMLDAIYEDNSKVIAYTAWSIVDNFEWNAGYNEKFGVYAVDFTSSNRTRTPKKSAMFFQQLTSTRRIPDINIKDMKYIN